MKIQSNTKGIFDRMLSGQVFDNTLTFITEFFQNSQRANAKNIFISIEDDILTFSDDGCGLKNPKHLLTFNESSWESTTEGFGLGFWSILSIPNLSLAEINSKKNYIKIDIEKAKEDLEVDVEKTEDNYPGFKVKLKSNYFISNRDEILQKIKDEGKVIPLNVHLNDSLIEKIDIFKDFNGVFVKEYNTKYFRAKLSISRRDYAEVQTYYEYRPVCRLYDFSYVKGIIDLKKNAVDLKVPDRTSIIYNDKRRRLLHGLEKCVKSLYKDFIKETLSSEDTIDLHEYASGILEYLEPKEFEKILFVDDIKDKKTFKLNVDTSFKQEHEEVINLLNDMTDSGEWEVKKESDFDSIDIIDISNLERADTTLLSKEDVDKFDEIVIGETTLVKVNKNTDTTSTNEQEVNNNNSSIENTTDSTENSLPTVSLSLEEATVEEDRFITTTQTIKKNPKKKNSFTIKDLINSNKSLIWVASREVSDFDEAIALAEYNGLTVFVAPNKLYEMYLKAFNIAHITELESSMREEYSFKNLNPKNGKEETFLKLLSYITNHYKISPNTFKIGEIECSTIIEYNGKTILNKKSKNTTNNIQIYGVRSGDEIILDRKALDLKSFKISPDRLIKPGKHEFMAIAYNLNTIAHELAHRLYNTKDNTKEHTRMELSISNEILNIYKKLL